MSKIKRFASFLISLSLITGIVQPSSLALNKTDQNSIPIITKDETIELLNEQVDPEEYTAGGDAYATYWESIPPLNLSPGEPSSSYKIITEDGREMPLYVVKKDDDTDITIRYYLYCIYNYREFNLHGSYYTEDMINGYNNFLFYTTLPYRDGYNCSIIGFTSDGFPLPDVISEPRCMRAYSLNECENGGTITYDAEHTLDFNGMGNLWFAKTIGGTYKSRWASTKGFDYPLSTTNNLKDTLQTVPLAYLDSSFTEGYRYTQSGDPTAFIQYGDKYLVPRRVVSAYSLAVDYYKNPTPIGITTFVGDSGPSGQNGRPRGLWEPDNIKYLPWNGQLGEFGASTDSNKMVMYSGSVNKNFISSTGEFCDIPFKSITFEDKDIEAIKGMLNAGNGTNFDVYKNAGYGLDNVGKDKNNNSTFYYLDPANPDYALAYGLIRTWNYTDGFHPENDTGDYLNPRDVDSAVVSSNIGQDFGWGAFMLDNKQSTKYGTNITDFHIGDKYFFVGPVQANIYGDLATTFMEAGNDETTAIEKAEAYINCVDTGKFLYFLQFFSADYGTIDPCSPVDESKPYTITPTISWQSNGKAGYEAGSQHYNTETCPRIYDKKTIPSLPSSVHKDLVVSGAQEDNLITDEWYKTNLYKVREDVSDIEFKNIVGYSKDDFNKLSSSLYTDNHIKTGTAAAVLKDINKADFEKCFVALTKDDNVSPDTTYVLQSAVYGTASVKNSNEAIPTSDMYLATYNDNIYLGWKTEKSNGRATGRHQPNYMMDDTKNLGNGHYIFPQAFNDANFSAKDPNGEALEKITPSNAKATATKIATTGNRLNIMGTAENDTYTPINLTDKIIDSRGKENNIKLYRSFVHTPTEEQFTEENPQFSIDVFLFNPNSDHSSPNNVYVTDTQAAKREELTNVLYEAYKVATQKVAGNDPSLQALIAPHLNAVDTAAKEQAIRELVGICGQEKLHKANDNIDLAWMAGNVNDNLFPHNDQVQLTFKVNPSPTPAQRNLKVLFCTVYGSADKGLTWTQFYRSTPIDHSYFNTTTGQYEIDLVGMGMELNTAQDYFIAVAQQYDTVLDEAMKETLTNEELTNLPNSLGPDHSLYMYGFISSLGGKTDERNKIYFDYPTADSTQPWTDTEVNKHLNKPTGYFRSTSSNSPDVTAAVQNWSQDYGLGTRENQILSGKYYNELISAGGSKVRHKADGTAYIDDTYILGVHPDWSSNTDDTQNNNTSLPLPCDDCEDPEELVIKYRFSNGKDFDNKITDIYLLDKDGNRIDTTEDCFNPGKITDIDINSSDPYFSTEANLADHSYSLVVKVERNITGKEHKDIGNQCELTFVGNLFGREYTETAPLVLSLANSSGNISNDKHNVANPVYNNGNSLAKNGDYITYYVNGLLPIQDTEICGTFIFKHREEDGTLTTNDMNMLNNYKKGAVNWGPLDYIVSNLIIWPDTVYATEDQVWIPEDNSDLIHFSCNIEAQYTAPDGSRPIINNDALDTNFTLHLETRTGQGGDYVESGLVFKIDNVKLSINTGAKNITGIVKTNRRALNDQLNIISEGYPVRYNKNYAYRLVARINGGNGITESSTQHEHPEDQKVKLETIRTNNKDIAYFEIKAAPPDEEPLCPTPHIRNDWSITFYWTECPTPYYYTCCSGDPSHCSTCCTGTGCHSWNETKDYWETYEMSGEIRTTANGWKWEPLGSNTELRAGQRFQIRIISEYRTNRDELPPPEPYGGCTWRSRSPGHAYTTAYRYIRAKLINTEGGQIKRFHSNRGGHYQITESDIYYVPEDTKNLKLTVIAETSPFWGIREKGNQKLCTNYKADFSINSPLPIIEGNQIIL